MNHVQEKMKADALNPYLRKVAMPDEDSDEVRKRFKFGHIIRNEDFMSCGIEMPAIVILLKGTVIVHILKPADTTSKDKSKVQCTGIHHLKDQVIIIDHEDLDMDGHAPETFKAESDCSFIYILKEDLDFLRTNVAKWDSIEIQFYKPALNKAKNDNKNLLVFNSDQKAQKYSNNNEGAFEFSDIKDITSLNNVCRNAFDKIYNFFHVFKKKKK